MNLLYILHMYPPHHNAGSEWMVHNINQYMVSKGHKVRVLLRKGAIKHAYHFQGVDVDLINDYPQHHIQWANVVFTHLDMHPIAFFWAKHFGRPCVHFVHNTFPYPILDANQQVKLVYNSEAIVPLCNYKHDYTVLNPPVYPETFEGLGKASNEYITLINLNELKGGKVLQELAKRMPDRKFLGVIGGYDEQITDMPDNVTIHPHTDNIREVYAKTRLLIMPSRYESWGRTATEAMAAGIPVIANKTFGLEANLSYAGVWADRDNVDEWVKAIKKLDKEKEYNRVSELGIKRAKELDPEPQLQKYEQWLTSIAY